MMKTLLLIERTRRFSLSKTLVFSSILLSALLALPQAYASGSYTPTVQGQTLPASYHYGKSIFYGRVLLNNSPACASCHTDKSRLQRSALLKISGTLSARILACSVHKHCKTYQLKEKDIMAVQTYLTKRYRLQ